ncbi:MAG TPA: matrixin family metalloprotease [Polyangiaceae bacterium]|nr:matrixin family metalloprotease [Polyangiaceae bacterium]
MKLRTRGAKLGVAALCVIPTLAWSTSAFAYCLAMSCELGEKSNNPCPRDENKCVTQGEPVHWGSPCLTYTVQVDGSPKSKLDADEVQAYVAQAFNAWKSVRCPGGGSPRFQAQFAGYVSCDRHEVMCENAAKNDNVIMFHDQTWVTPDSQYGVTTRTGSKSSGLIVDADIEINSKDYSFKSDPGGMMSISLPFVLTHEIGHFLGLAHSPSGDALMFATYGFQSAPLSHSLFSPDDVAAICAAYPPGPELSCPAPNGPAYDKCQIPLGEERPCVLQSATEEVGCSCHLAPAPTRPWPAFAALGLLLTTLRTRRSRKQRRDPS